MNNLVHSQKVAAACVFMNSWELLALNIVNLIGLGVKDFFLLDHRSADDRREEFQEVFAGRANLHFFRKPTAVFYHAVMSSYLADQAKGRGFDTLWIFDADEFLHVSRQEVPKVYSELDLRSRGLTHIKIESRNFFQRHDVVSLGLSTLKTFKPAIDLNEFPLLSFCNLRLRLAPLGKCIINLHRVRIGQILEFGNHYHPGKSKSSSNYHVVHLPYSSPASLTQRAQHGRNLSETNESDLTGLHNRNLSKMEETQLSNMWGDLTWVPGGYSGVKVDEIDESIIELQERIRENLPTNFLRCFTAGKVPRYDNSDYELASYLDARGKLNETHTLIAKISRIVTRSIRVIARLRLRIVPCVGMK